MSIQKDPSGRRSVTVEVEVPGTPEQVWAAIATGPGISAWFVPTTGSEGVGGKLTFSFGPGFDTNARITEWQPPHRFVAIGDAQGPGQPELAAEWIVEARAGGTCVVRVVNSYFTDRDDWDGQLEGMESGWPAFFEVLRLYLSEFRGRPAASVQAMAMSQAPLAELWPKLLRDLDLEGHALGTPWQSQQGPQQLAGRVTRSRDGMLVAQLQEPTAGAMCLSACEHGGAVVLGVNFYLYGGPAAANATEAWQAWLAARA